MTSTVNGAGASESAEAIIRVRDMTARYGDNLVFEKPIAFRGEFFQKLVDAGRVHAVRRPELKRHSAKGFCWVMPNETLLHQGERYVPSASGGFVYELEDAEGASSFVLFKLVPHESILTQMREGMTDVAQGISSMAQQAAKSVATPIKAMSMKSPREGATSTDKAKPAQSAACAIL